MAIMINDPSKRAVHDGISAGFVVGLFAVALLVFLYFLYLLLVIPSSDERTGGAPEISIPTKSEL